MYKISGLICLFITAALHSVMPETTLNVALGGRQDTFNEIETLNDKLIGDPDSIDIHTKRRLFTVQAGFDGTLRLSDLWRRFIFCDVNIFDQFYIRETALFGLGCYGKYREHVKGDVDNFYFGSHRNRASDIYSQYFNAAIGFLIPFHDCFSVGPVYGYSYDRTRFKVNYVKNVVSFQGPFVGVDVAFVLKEFRLDGGYEYHALNKCAKFDLQQHQSYGFHFDKRLKNGVGHSGYLKLSYDPYQDCKFAVKGLVSYYSADKLHAVSPDYILFLKNIDWYTFTLLLEFGKKF